MPFLLISFIDVRQVLTGDTSTFGIGVQRLLLVSRSQPYRILWALAGSYPSAISGLGVPSDSWYNVISKINK